MKENIMGGVPEAPKQEKIKFAEIPETKIRAAVLRQWAEILEINAKQIEENEALAFNGKGQDGHGNVSMCFSPNMYIEIGDGTTIHTQIYLNELQEFVEKESKFLENLKHAYYGDTGTKEDDSPILNATEAEGVLENGVVKFY